MKQKTVDFTEVQLDRLRLQAQRLGGLSLGELIRRYVDDGLRADAAPYPTPENQNALPLADAVAPPKHRPSTSAIRPSTAVAPPQHVSSAATASVGEPIGGGLSVSVGREGEAVSSSGVGGEGERERVLPTHQDKPKKQRAPLTARPATPPDLASPELEAMLEEWDSYRRRRADPMSERAWMKLFNVLRGPSIGRANAALAVEYAIGENWKGVWKPERLTWTEIARQLGKAPVPPDPSAPKPLVRRRDVDYGAELEEARMRLLKVPEAAEIVEKLDHMASWPTAYPTEVLEDMLAELRRRWPRPLIIPGVTDSKGEPLDGWRRTEDGRFVPLAAGPRGGEVARTGGTGASP